MQMLKLFPVVALLGVAYAVCTLSPAVIETRF